MTRQELAEEIRALGLASGDVVILHSSLGSIGDVDGGAGTVVDGFLDVLGEEGTLVVPTFGAWWDEVYDPRTTPAALGAVTEAVVANPKAVRSLHPMASVAAIGDRAAEIVRDHEKAATAHAEGTPYTRIAELGGYVVLLGVDQDRNTTLHTAEALCRLPYLSTRSKKYLDTDGNEHEGTWDYFPGPHRDFIGMDKPLRERGVVKLGKVGRAVVRIMRSRDLIDAAVEMIEADPAACLCDNPSCDDCVRQRAAITASRLAGEPFRLVASSGAAGGSADEVAANLRATGVSAVELDSVGGRAVASMRKADLEDLAATLGKAGIAVASVACVPLRVKMKKALAACETLGARRIVLPLEPAREKEIAAAAECGVEVLLRNSAVKGERASEMLAAYPEEVGLSFDPAGFLAGGEKPFSKSLKIKGRRRMRQLVLADATRDGRSTPLARGSCEIRELLSILRCRSFEGDMVLGRPGRETPEGQAPGGFRALAASFMTMLGSL